MSESGDGMLLALGSVPHPHRVANPLDSHFVDGDATLVRGYPGLSAIGASVRSLSVETRFMCGPWTALRRDRRL